MVLANRQLLEEMYEKFNADPSSIDDAWRQFFQDLETPGGEKHVYREITASGEDDLRVFNLINSFRTYGHLMAKINPIATRTVEVPDELKLETFGFTSEDLSRPFFTFGLLDKKETTLTEIVDTLRAIYCNKIGIEYMGLQQPEIEKWLQKRIEPNRFSIKLSIDQKKMILQNLNKSELFEVFLHTKYTGQKRFSIEGGETLIPILEAIIETGAGLDSEVFVIGMAHRGRINVLSNILKKSYGDVFSEFEEGYIPNSFEGSGDVKYHKGYFSEGLTVHGHKVSVALTPNPSHLEAVDSVVEGQSRAKQDLLDWPKSLDKVMPILVHGDAAVSGQGVVYETLQLGGLEGYKTGGTVHIVINNQIGFTTLPRDARSTRYCTAIARTFSAPVFHVNAEDPEGCIYAAILAVEIRQKFHCDVFIDMNCYRKYGHNETDEPAFTQPLEYQIIRKKKPVREIYRDDLITQGVLEKKMAEALEEEFKQALQEALKEVKAPLRPSSEKQITQSLNHQDLFSPVKTGVAAEILQSLAGRFCTVPKGFTIHPKLQNLLNERLAMVNGGKPIDWGMAEMLAYASLLDEGTSIRISGQDSCRGTFSHRHGIWVDQKEEQTYFPLQHLKEGQGRFDLINSPLSEFGVLGFEYGYSLSNPDALVIWEAQFGDFCNGAQVVIDQFISPGEQKWAQKSGLTLLLPHGYEGQGPEHSSARMERFLTLAGHDNILVVNPTTPAQLFHLLRRQVLSSYQKPLIVFTPKGLLRYSECVNALQDLTQGGFIEILDDPQPAKECKRLVFCSGRIYYDLLVERKKAKKDDLAIIRVEQLYPFHVEKCKMLIEKYKTAAEFLWVQEEHSNMGAWTFIGPVIQSILPANGILKYIGRERSASPAVGSYALHKKQHAEIIGALFPKE